MQSRKFDHVLTLKIKAEMLDQIDRAVVLLQDPLVQTRSEFLRMAAAYALESVRASESKR